MKKFIFVILFLFTANTALAAVHVKAPESLAVNIDFHYQQHDKNRLVDQYLIKDKIEMTTNSNKWTIVQNPQLPAANQRYILLSKIDKVDFEEVAMSFLILDMGKNPNIISKPTLIVRYGQPAQVELENGSEKIKLSITAKA